MRRKPPANKHIDENQILWQRVTQRVAPMPGRQQKLSPSPMAKQSVKAAKPVVKLPPNISKSAPHSPSMARLPSPIDLRDGDRAGLDGRTWRRLSRGDLPIDRRLDLHGHTVARAEVKLQKFLEDAAHRGCRCVLVISGKGAGVLQKHIPLWLKQGPLSGRVLALTEARPTDGGSGAFYVLLRRRRP